MRRNIGKTDIEITSVGMGCWPIAGMTSIDVNEQDSITTLRTAHGAGVNFFDTAYCYGVNGESEKLIAEALGAYRSEIVIASKAGIAWDENRQRIHTGKPDDILRQAEESLARLNTDRIDLFYLHAPDPDVPIRQSASAYQKLWESKVVRAVGVSNCSVAQLREFQEVCPVEAVQPHYNMLQREIEVELVPYCLQEQISVITYWPLMKGLLAGKLQRDHSFAPNDGRAKYPMFQGSEWEKNQDFVDILRGIASAVGKSVSQVVVNWTMNRPGITSALCGAKRGYQIEETAGAMGWELAPEQLKLIEQAIEKRGTPITRAAV